MEVFTMPAAAGIIEKEIDGIDYILIQERWKEGKEAENGLLEIPGGKIREYENVFDCLRREIMEESGLKVTYIEGESEARIYENHGYRVVNYQPFTCSQNIQGTYAIMVEVFLCRAEGEPATETNETQNIRWVPVVEAAQLVEDHKERFFPMHLAALEKYVEYKK